MNARPPAARLSAEALAFSPGLLAIQESPPAPMARAMLLTLCALVAGTLVWVCVGQLDIVASAPGRLVPAGFLKTVQAAEAGEITEILVHEGQAVRTGQLLLRMDSQDAQAEATALQGALAKRSLQLRRIDAELGDRPLARLPGDTGDGFAQVQAQLEMHRQAYREAMALARQSLARAEYDEQAGRRTLEKLEKTDPIYREQAKAYADLGANGYVARADADDKQRQYIENSQELQAQRERVASLGAAVEEARRQSSELQAKARSDLQNERIEAAADHDRLEQERLKELHRTGLLEIRATADGVVKDLGTHTIGTVVSAGAVLLSIVPETDRVLAEVLVRNEDVGFVHAGQAVRLKIASYSFQKYGTVDGHVRQVWPDAVEAGAGERAGRREDADADADAGPIPGAGPGDFKALIDLDGPSLGAGSDRLRLVPGMRVVAEIDQGRRTVLDYLLSPIRRVTQEGGHER